MASTDKMTGKASAVVLKVRSEVTLKICEYDNVCPIS